MPMQIKNLQVGDIIHNDVSGHAVYEVMQIDSHSLEVSLKGLERKNFRLMDWESLEHYWSIGRPQKGWSVNEW
jgi:hypothetical protein